MPLEIELSVYTANGLMGPFPPLSVFEAYGFMSKRPFDISPSSARFMLFDCQPRLHKVAGTPVSARLLSTILPLAMDESQRRWVGRCLRPSQGFCLTNDDLGEGQFDHRCRVSAEKSWKT